MKAISKFSAFYVLGISILGFLILPLLAIAESRGNPLLNKNHPEEAGDRASALWISWVAMVICLLNSAIYLLIGQMRETKQARKDAEAEAKAYEQGLDL
jgi:hypothetical protein